MNMGVRSWFVAVMALGFLGSASGCRGNVHPGDPDYPAENPQPTQSVELTIIEPPYAKLEFIAGYEATVVSDDCSYELGAAGTRPYYIVSPINPAGVGNVRRATIILDRYQSGRCRYAFTGAFYRPSLRFESVGSLELLRVDPARATETERADVYCLDIAKEPRCGSLRLMASGLNAKVSKEEEALLTSKGGAKFTPLYIGPVTRSITVQFHDLDAKDRPLDVSVP
jgi:hypothetical protein